MNSSESILRKKSDHLSSSFIIEKENQRGMYAATGGVEEAKIAAQYHEDASKMRIQYPRTAAILLAIGDDYLRRSQHDKKRERLFR